MEQTIAVESDVVTHYQAAKITGYSAHTLKNRYGANLIPAKEIQRILEKQKTNFRARPRKRTTAKPAAKYTELKIDKDMPMPDRGHRRMTSQRRDPWKDAISAMEVGDSVALGRVKKDDAKGLHSLTSKGLSILKNLKRKGATRRMVIDDTIYEVRMWRIA